MKGKPKAVSVQIATNNAMVEKTYTLEQAAPILHQTIRTLRQWRKDGKIHCFKLGKVWVVSDDELQRVIDNAKKGN
jgi:predicted site-specific integrase-resolvase